MAGREPSISRRRILGAAAAVPLAALPVIASEARQSGEADGAEAGCFVAPLLAMTWKARLAAYRRLAARAKEGAEVGWFRKANDRYYRRCAEIAARFGGAEAAAPLAALPVIASEARQSSGTDAPNVDCFVAPLLAMTWKARLAAYRRRRRSRPRGGPRQDRRDARARDGRARLPAPPPARPHRRRSGAADADLTATQRPNPPSFGVSPATPLRDSDVLAFRHPGAGRDPAFSPSTPRGFAAKAGGPPRPEPA